MKTSFSEIIEAEKYLDGGLNPEESLMFEARLVIDENLRRNTFFQAMVNRLTRLYHRRQLKAEVEAVHKKLFDHPANVSFRKSITNIFND